MSAVHILHDFRPFLLGAGVILLRSRVIIRGWQIQGCGSSQVDGNPYPDVICDVRSSLMVSVAGSWSSHLSWWQSASAGLAWVRDVLCSLDSSSAILSALRSSTNCLLVANLAFMSTNKFMTAVRLCSLSSELGSPVWLGGNSGGCCFLLAVCFPLFLGMSGATLFLDLDLGAIVG